MASSTSSVPTASKLESTPIFAIEAVQTIVAEATKQIAIDMVRALMSKLMEKLSFTQLANKHINVNLASESAINEKTQRVYQKLFNASEEHIRNYSQPLLLTFAAMNKETADENTGKKFLGSFVLRATGPMIERLEKEQAGSVECVEIWK